MVLLIIGLGFVAGCATSFKYQPRHDQTYPPVANNLGVEIIQAQDVRADDEKLPQWSRKVETIVARAVADELNHAKLFQRVTVHLSGPLAKNKYSHAVELRVKQFRYYNPTNILDYGREILGWMGPRGALISASIPRQYVSEVAVEFEVLDAANQQTVFLKTYSDSRTLTANGYEGKTRQIKQTSDALESVVTQFVRDLVRLPLSRVPARTDNVGK